MRFVRDKLSPREVRLPDLKACVHLPAPTGVSHKEEFAVQKGLWENRPIQSAGKLVL